MNTALRPTMCRSECGEPAGTNCGRNAKKKIVSFGLSRFSVIPDDDHLARRAALRGAARSASAPVSRQVAHAR